MPGFVDALGSVTDLRIVEFGCGIGVVTSILTAAGCDQILAIDQSKRMLDLASRNCGHQPNVHFRLDSFDESLVWDQTVDLAVFAFALEQQTTRAAIATALRNAAAVVNWDSRDARIDVLIPHPCFDLRQSGDISRTLVGMHGDRRLVQVELSTPAHEVVRFRHVHWTLEDYLCIAASEGLVLSMLRELGSDPDDGAAAVPYYMLLRFVKR